MRGGVTIDEAYNLSHEDKMLINDIVKEKILFILQKYINQQEILCHA